MGRHFRIIGDTAVIPLRPDDAPAAAPHLEADDDSPARDLDVRPAQFQRLFLLEDFLGHVFGPETGWSATPPIWGTRDGITNANGAPIQAFSARGRSGRPHVVINLARPLIASCPIFRAGVASHELEHIVAGDCDRVSPDSPLSRFSYDHDPEAGERRADEAGARVVQQIAEHYNKKRSPDAPMVNAAGCRRCFLEHGPQCRQPEALPHVQERLMF